jgi:hypothetical protein
MLNGLGGRNSFQFVSGFANPGFGGGLCTESFFCLGDQLLKRTRHDSIRRV